LGKSLKGERLVPPSNWLLEWSLAMLVLSRRLHEKVVFPGLNVTVQVVAIKPGVVRIGIEAPPDVAVVREEILAERCPNRSVRLPASASCRQLCQA
jgi:carbon storage regulator CsrA